MDRSLLFVYAHPDDESFLGAGVVGRYLDEGVRGFLVTATRGERGKMGDPPLCTREELPRVREAEGRRAASIIGFDTVRFLDYKDKELADAPIDQIRRELVSLIRLHRPTIVVTFDPEGMNRHTDHVAISRFTSDAVVAAADPRWLPDTGSSHQVARLLWTPPVRPWEWSSTPDLRALPGVDFVVDTRRWWRRKADALAAHETQRPGITKLFLGRKDVEDVLSLEVFRQAWGPPLAGRPSDDLFAGLA